MTHDQQLYLRTLSEFTRTLVTSYDVETVFGELTSRITAMLQLAGTGVTLARKGHLEFVTAAPAELADLERAQMENQSGPCVVAYQTGRIEAIADIETRSERWPEYCAVAKQVGVRAVAGIPMQLDRQNVGAINLYDSVNRDWSDRDLAAATVMANMATAYLINASMLDKQKRLAEQLQRALDSRVVIEQAKGVLANEHGISVEEAFERIRKHARTHGATVHAVAEAVVQVGLRPD